MENLLLIFGIAMAVLAHWLWVDPDDSPKADRLHIRHCGECLCERLLNIQLVHGVCPQRGANYNFDSDLYHQPEDEQAALLDLEASHAR